METNEILCPYCSSPDVCEHFFATYDPCGGTIPEGFLKDKLNPLIDVIAKFFKNHISLYGLNKESITDDCYWVEQLWNEILHLHKYYTSSNIEFEFTDLIDHGAACRVILDVSYLERVSYENSDEDSCGDYFTLYTDEDPYEVYNHLLVSLENYLALHVNENLKPITD